MNPLNKTKVSMTSSKVLKSERFFFRENGVREDSKCDYSMVEQQRGFYNSAVPSEAGTLAQCFIELAG